MESEMNRQDRIDRYLRGEMSEPERRDFERDLLTDQSLKDEYAIAKGLVDALKERKARLDKIRKWDNEIEEEKRRKIRLIRIRKYTSYSIGIAACVVVGFFGIKGIFFNHSSMSPEWGNSEQTYRSNMDEQIASVLDLKKIDSLHGEYLANLRSAKHDPDLTDEERAVLENEAEVNLYELEWSKINLLLSQGKRKEAKKLLLTFKEKKGRFKNKADSLYQELK